MRILWIKAGGLLPLDTGGKIRSYHTLAELAKRHSVTVYTFYKAHTDDAHERLSAQFERFIPQPLDLPDRGTPADLYAVARALVGGRAYTMQKYYRPEVRTTVQRLCGSEVSGPDAFDVIVCDFMTPAGLIPWGGRTPTVLFTHNVEAEVWDRQVEVTRNPLLRQVLRREAVALRRAEAKYSRKADHVVAVSERNAEHFRSVAGHDRVTAVPTGVDVEFFRPGTSDRAMQPMDLVFTGSMDWMPNDDSVRFFVRDVLPQVWAQLPAVRFWAVGRNPSDGLRALDDGERVRITGKVDDIRPFLDQAALFVVPMRSGSGTRLKIYEAMAAGKAIVSTTIGAEGLAGTDGESIVFADSPEDFARSVVSLLEDPARAADLGRAARELVVRHHSWSAAVRPFEDALERAIRFKGGT